MKRRYVFPPQCEYIVNEEKRTVICVVHTADQDNEVGMEWATAQNLRDDLMVDAWYLRMKDIRGARLPRHFAGKAVCSPNDKWDVEIGKKIARYRALEKYHYSTIRRMRTMLEKMKKKQLAVENRLFDEINATNEYLRDLHREAFK